MAGSEESEKKRSGKGRRGKRRTTVEHIRNLWWTKREAKICELPCVGKERRRFERKKAEKRNKSPKTKQFLGRSGRWLFLLLILMQNWFCVDAAAGRVEPKVRSGSAGNHCRVGCGGRHFREPGWRKHSKGAEGKAPEKVETDKKELTGLRKEEVRLRCALLNGSAWSTERQYMRRYRGTFDIFSGTEHRLRKEQMEEQFIGKPRKDGRLQRAQQEPLRK